MCKKEACKVASFLHMSCLFNMGLESLENNQQICRSLNLICYDSSMFNSWLIHTYINKHLSSELDFLASDVGYQCDVDIRAIFTIICQCSCSHVNVCHSLFNEDFVNSHWFSGDHPIPFVLNVRDKYYQSMRKRLTLKGFLKLQDFITPSLFLYEHIDFFIT